MLFFFLSNRHWWLAPATCSRSPSFGRQVRLGSTWLSVVLSASACRWALEGLTPVSSLCASRSYARCPADWSEYPSICICRSYS